MTLKVGILGYGYWGPNITRNFMESPNCEVVQVCDAREERLDLIRRLYPGVKLTTDPDEVISDPGIDAIAVILPVRFHYPFARKALEAGKHVLIEKPMTMNTEEADVLIELAEKKGLQIMVDHTFQYTGAVEKIKELVDSGEVGQLKYIDSTRINLGLFQDDVNVLWDLAAHDLSVIDYLSTEKPASVQAIGVSHLNNGIANIAYLIIHYPSGMIVHLNCSWTSPVKIRQMLIGGDKKMIVYNDIEPTDKVKIYDRGYTVKTDDERRQVLVDYRLGDCSMPKISMREALAGVISDFYLACTEGKKPRADAVSGREVVKLLEAADRSLNANGAEIPYHS